MANQSRWSGEDRRAYARVAGRGQVKAAVVDDAGQTCAVLSHAQVVNVSSGGLAFTSQVPAEVGARVNVRVGEDGVKPFSVRIVGADRRGDGHCELRAQLIDGSIPACLMYDW